MQYQQMALPFPEPTAEMPDVGISRSSAEVLRLALDKAQEQHSSPEVLAFGTAYRWMRFHTGVTRDYQSKAFTLFLALTGCEAEIELVSGWNKGIAFGWDTLGPVKRNYPCILRFALESDLQGVADLAKTCDMGALTLKRLRVLYEDQGLIVALDELGVIGFSCFRFKNGTEITAIGVAPEVRRRGIATKIVETFGRCRALCLIDSADGNDFFRATGFVLDKTQKKNNRWVNHSNVSARAVIYGRDLLT